MSAAEKLEATIDDYNKELYERTNSASGTSKPYDADADAKRRQALKSEIVSLTAGTEGSSINARQKRKFNRFLEFVDQSMQEVEALKKKNEASANSSAITATSSAIGESQIPLGAKKVPTKFIDHAKVADASVVLDSIVIPDRKKLSSDAEYEEKKNAILKILEGLSASPDTNKIIRRRISRMTYVLNNPTSSGESSTPSSSAAPSKPATSSKIASIAPSTAVAVNNSTDNGIEGRVASLLQSSTAEDIDANLSACSVDILNINSSKLLKSLILKLNEWFSGTGGIFLPSKLKRRVGRLSEQLSSTLSNANEADENDNSNNNNSSSNSNNNNSSSSSSGYAASSSGKGAAAMTAPTTITTATGKTIDIHAILKKIRFSKDAPDIEKCLIFIKLNIKELVGNKELSKLLSKKKEDFEAMLEGKALTRYTQLLDLFKKGPEGVMDIESNIKGNEGDVVNSKSGGVAVEPPQPEKHVPCVVFVGQLSFKLTAEELEKFLRSNGVEGSISVRLLTEAHTNASRGMAFVELEGPREMAKTLALHHSVLGGRKINIEQSCGGRNKEVRASKIVEKRQEQTKATFEQIDNILREYETQGVISVDALDEGVKRTFYYNPPSFLREVMEKFMKKPEDSRTLGDLSSIAYIHRNIKYGMGTANSGSGGERGDSMQEGGDEGGQVVSEISIKLIKRARENSERAAKALKRQKE